jgi:hypothetical protein
MQGAGGLKYIWRYSHKDGGNEGELLAEVEGVTRDLVHWRHTVDLQERMCTCRRWQVTGLPCTHALCIVTSIRGNIEDYVHDYYFVAKFKKAYGKSVKPMTDCKQWPQVNLGFKLWPPQLKRAPERQRETRYKSVAEGALEREPHNAKGVCSLDIWKKYAMIMFMILMHHHPPLQNPREREARKCHNSVI